MEEFIYKIIDKNNFDYLRYSKGEEAFQMVEEVYQETMHKKVCDLTISELLRYSPLFASQGVFYKNDKTELIKVTIQKLLK